MLRNMIDTKQLGQFLVTARRSTYAAGAGAAKTVEADHSTTLVFEDGDFKYHDNYFGGEPFGGREVVFWKDEPIYIMTYYGLVDESVSGFEAVYRVLQNALALIPEEHPFRGPEEYVEGDLTYQNSFAGEVDNFSGEEIISSADGKEIYRAKYAGGFVDQRKE